MFGYYLRLASLSFRRTPGITALMVLAIAAGISVCVMSLTLFHAISGNPIWWKSDRLYAVTMDAWSAERPADPRRPDQPPPQLSYRDSMFLAKTPIAQRSGRGVVLAALANYNRPTSPQPRNP